MIGRAEGGVRLVDPRASRRHAVLRLHPLRVVDLGSKNGTYVNGRRVYGTHPLRPGDRVRFGETVWQISAAGRNRAG